jgi:hypothetical protein
MTRIRQDQRDMAYRIYVSDALRMISESAAKAVGYLSRGGGEASYLTRRYVDVIGIGSAKAANADPEKGRAGILRKLKS